FPQILPGGHLIVTLADAPEKTPENGLDKVFKIDPKRQFRRGLGPRQSAKTLDVAEIKLARSVVVALIKVPQQRAVGGFDAPTRWIFFGLCLSGSQTLPPYPCAPSAGGLAFFAGEGLFNFQADGSRRSPFLLHGGGKGYPFLW